MATIRTTAHPAAGLGTWINDLRHELGKDLQRRRVYNQTYEQLAGLSDRDLADIGVSRLQIADIAREAADRR